MSGIYVGIDLGTTNSVVSVITEVEGRPPEIKVPHIHQPGRSGQRLHRQRLLPSVVYFEGPGRAVVGELAWEKASVVPHRCSRSIKSKMGRLFVMDVDGVAQTPVTISAHILQALRDFLCQHLNTDVRDAVITVPASFTTAQREDTINAARLAGFNMGEGTLMDEPTAALLDFLYDQVEYHRDDRLLDFSVPRNLMVFDLGGGTLDISMVRVENSPGGGHCLDARVLARSRYTNLGGDDFDLALAAYLSMAYEREKGVSLGSLTPERRREISHRLLARAEDVKMQLVEEEEMQALSGAGPGERALAEVNVIVQELAFRTSVSTGLYERLVAHLLGPGPGYHKHIMQPVEDALRESGLGAGQVDRIFMVGGMSRLPCVKKALAAHFPGRELHSLNFDHAVARGAAIHHRHLCRGLQDIRFQDSLSEGVYIKRDKERAGVVESGFAEVIPGDTAPGSDGVSQRNFYLAEDQQREVCLNLYRGRGEDDPLMVPLASMKFGLKKAYPRGTGVGLRWHVDSNKRIRIEGWLKDHPGEEPFVLEAEGNYLTGEEIEEARHRCLCGVNMREVI